VSIIGFVYIIFLLTVIYLVGISFIVSYCMFALNGVQEFFVLCLLGGLVLSPAFIPLLVLLLHICHPLLVCRAARPDVGHSLLVLPGHLLCVMFNHRHCLLMLSLLVFLPLWVAFT